MGSISVLAHLKVVVLTQKSSVESSTKATFEDKMTVGVLATCEMIGVFLKIGIVVTAGSTIGIIGTTSSEVTIGKRGSL